MNLTEQQEEILYYCQKNKNKDKMILINACAGSGKTSVLKAISTKVYNENSLYLAYNNSIAVESRSKFPSNVQCRTTHSVANEYIVQPHHFKVGNVRWNHIEGNLSYSEKNHLLEYIKEYCLSKYLDWFDYVEDNGINQKLKIAGSTLLSNMLGGKIPMSFDFSLKLFHLFLNHNHKEMKPYDILMLDEAGDLNEVTLEIFKLIPAKMKIAVGDQNQNIYGFNHTVNCFNLLEGQEFFMTQSFRVSPAIGEKVQTFFQKHLDKNLNFIGASNNTEIKTKAYITRTNSSLVRKITEFEKDNIPYKLTRGINEIFEIPLLMSSLKYKGQMKNIHYQFLQDFVDDFYEDILKRYKGDIDVPQEDYDEYVAQIEKKHYEDLLKAIKRTFHEDIELISGINLIKKIGKDLISSTFEELQNRNDEDIENAIFLTTAHSSKGLEFDYIYLDDDIDRATARVILSRMDVESEVKKAIDNIENKSKEKLEVLFKEHQLNLQKIHHSPNLMIKEKQLYTQKVDNENKYKEMRVQKETLEIEFEAARREKDYVSELNLYYVACTRASVQIENAQLLDFNGNEKEFLDFVMERSKRD